MSKKNIYMRHVRIFAASGIYFLLRLLIFKWIFFSKNIDSVNQIKQQFRIHIIQKNIPFKINHLSTKYIYSGSKKSGAGHDILFSFNKFCPNPLGSSYF